MMIGRSFVLGCNVVAALSLVACVSSDEQSEADAENMGDGKADVSSFRFGPYAAVDPTAAEDKQPLLAIFHPADGSEPEGDHGQFDLTRLKDDYDATYEQGTFKLYTWNGRKRIRFSRYDGSEVLRTDWSKSGEGIELAGIEMYQGNRLDNELIDCLAVEIIDSNIFEESLSVNEYPNVSVDKVGPEQFDLDIGSSLIDHAEATVTVTSSTTRGFEAKGKVPEGTYIIRVPTKAPRRGEVIFDATDAAPSTVATIVCR